MLMACPSRYGGHATRGHPQAESTGGHAIAAEVPIAVRDYGGGTDVLLLPGSLRTLDDWRLVVPLLLDAGLRVTAMDPRSHGRSPGFTARTRAQTPKARQSCSASSWGLPGALFSRNQLVASLTAPTTALP